MSTFPSSDRIDILTKSDVIQQQINVTSNLETRNSMISRTLYITDPDTTSLQYKTPLLVHDSATINKTLFRRTWHYAIVTSKRINHHTAIEKKVTHKNQYSRSTSAAGKYH